MIVLEYNVDHLGGVKPVVPVLDAHGLDRAGQLLWLRPVERVAKACDLLPAGVEVVLG